MLLFTMAVYVIQLNCLYSVNLVFMRCTGIPNKNASFIIRLLLTLARACAAKGYCSRSVYLSVGRSVCVCICSHVFSRTVAAQCRYQTWIYGYVQRALGTARVWRGVVQEQHVYGGDLKLYTVIILGVH